MCQTPRVNPNVVFNNNTVMIKGTSGATLNVGDAHALNDSASNSIYRSTLWLLI
jgi:hypothetical protein